MPVDVAPGLAQYLSEAWGQDVEISNLSQSTAGARRHNILFDATAGGTTHHLVATIVPFGETIINGVDAEAGVRDVAEKHGVAVPHVHLVRTDGDLVGGPFFISEMVEGETVPRRVLRLVEDKGIGETVVRQLGESLARLHSIDPSEVTVPLRTREFSGPPAVAALAGLRAQIDEMPLRRPAWELGMKWLERRLPDPPQRETIVHSDTRNGNLIVGEDGLRAVLDWEGTLASGDPMQDLAWPSLRMWRFRNDDKEIGGFAGREHFIEGYVGAGGDYDADRFHWWKVEGTLRWGVGLAGQTMGFLEGRVPSIVMAASGRRVPELEWDLLQLIRPG